MTANDLMPLKDWMKKFRGWWATSLGIVVALVSGVLIGILSVESRIINDCKYINSFRIGDQGYNCQRRP